jgi:ATP-binding cassette, subfamily B, bacterial CvaB/MchF/RaxB
MALMRVLDGLNIGWGARLPLILQSEAAECGLACLSMITSYLGAHSNLADLRRRFGMSLKGATLKDIVGIANHLGLAARPVRLEMEELSQLHAPCILHWDLNHFVVLKSVSRSGIVIHDPAFGLRRLPFSQVSKHFTGVALELTPTGGFEPAKSEPRVRLSALLGRMVGIKRSLLQLMCLALAIEVFAITSPLFMQWVVDNALVTADRDLLLTLVIGFSLLLLIRVSVEAMRGWMLMVLGASLKVQGRANLFSHLIHLPAAYYETRYMGDVMSRFGSQETVLQAITTELVEAILDGLMASITLIIMFVFAPTLAAVVLTGALLYALLRWGSYTPLRRASMEAIVWAARRDSHFLETLRGIKTIKLMNGHDARRAHWLSLLVETVNRQLTTQKLSLLFRTANSLLLGVLAIVVVWLGAVRVLENTFSVGMLLAFISYKDQFLRRVSEFINRMVDLQMLRLHTERLADIALTAPEPQEELLERVVNRLPPAIEARNLRYRYSENDHWVLDGVDFRIEPGESVAIVGVSGCGKTTLLKVLATLLQPTQGEILIDGEPIAHVGVSRYRSMIGVVMQDDQLFAGSIADNISFFSENPDPERIKECARLAAVHDDILAMPMGYGTLIGDMGTVLSGGQKQRVLIARSLYNKPAILLLDEATSHLDVGREKEVNAAIRNTQMTRIIVAHRPETIRSADRIIVLDRGRVATDLQVVAKEGRLPAPISEIVDDVEVFTAPHDRKTESAFDSDPREYNATVVVDSAAQDKHLPSTPARVTGTLNGGVYGPVMANENLWSIARKVRPNRDVSMFDMMQQLLAANPEAFINNDINLLREGSWLRVPGLEMSAAFVSPAAHPGATTLTTTTDTPADRLAQPDTTATTKTTASG